jgi:hypothetical protein
MHVIRPSKVHQIPDNLNSLQIRLFRNGEGT